MKIKQNPEDFIVKEVTDAKIKDEGEYLYFILKKKNYNTLTAIKHIADTINIPLNRFGFAGNKDKHAITEQLVSVQSAKKEKLEKLNLKDIEIKISGYGEKYVFLGNLKGNEFIITIRDLSQEEISNFKNKTGCKEILMPNYFGEQRFSSKNTDIGRAIIKRNFDEAASLLNLDIVDNDFIGAIRKIDKKILRLYVHAYQSYIFNETIKEYLEDEITHNEKIPIVGFNTELENYNENLSRIIRKILCEEGIILRDFITLKIPELSEEGSERDLFCKIENLKILGEEKEKMKIGFFLKKGSYATEVIKYLFK